MGGPTRGVPWGSAGLPGSCVLQEAEGQCRARCPPREPTVVPNTRFLKAVAGGARGSPWRLSRSSRVCAAVTGPPAASESTEPVLRVRRFLRWSGGGGGGQEGPSVVPPLRPGQPTRPRGPETKQRRGGRDSESGRPVKPGGQARPLPRPQLPVCLALDEDSDVFPAVEDSPFSRAFSRTRPVSRTYSRKKLIS